MIIINTFKENKTTKITSRCLNTDYTITHTINYYVRSYFLCVNMTLQWNNNFIEVTLKTSTSDYTVGL